MSFHTQPDNQLVIPLVSANEIKPIISTLPCCHHLLSFTLLYHQLVGMCLLNVGFVKGTDEGGKMKALLKALVIPETWNFPFKFPFRFPPPIHDSL